MVGLFLLAASLIAVDVPRDAADRSVPATERTLLVGQIYIEGADDMSASAILNTIGFHVGDLIPYRRLRTAERRLADLGLFEVNPVRDVRPHILPCQSGDIADLRIVVLRLAPRP